MDSPPSDHHRKRKRAASASDKVINPLSHTPATLKQFARAGYPTDAPLPSKAYPGFPHRAPGRQNRRKKKQAARHDESGDVESEGGASYKSSGASDGGGDAIDDADLAAGIDQDMIDTFTSAEESETHTHPVTVTETETETDGTDSANRRRRRSRKDEAAQQPHPHPHDPRAQAYRARVGCLAAVVRRCLAEGDVATAKRAFGLLARARVYGRRVDLRYEGYWEMGAEVLVREGRRGGAGRRREGEGEGEDEDGIGEGEGEEEEEEEEEHRLARLKTYYEYLIQQYPFSKQHPNSTNSVLDFQVALFSAEMEAAYAAHRQGLERLQRGKGAEGVVDEMDVDESELPLEDHHGDNGWDDEGREAEDHLRGVSRREIRLREQENSLRLAALQRMVDVARRMDTVMETVPFSRDHELLRLRAMVALYIGDLQVPPAPRSELEDRESKRERARQRGKAKNFLRRIKEGGGELKDHDERLLASLVSDEEGEEEGEEGLGLPMFSSLGV
ncbi:hypothetical protein VTK56DRAFT_6350 [Thermocarpiscus australiensis]